MKKLLVCAILLCFLSTALPGFSSFNVFLQRRVVVGNIKSPEEPGHDYLADSVRSSLYTTLLLVPFFTLTDEERTFLRHRSEEPMYSEAFQEAEGQIGYRMTPVVEKGPYTPDFWPLFLSGSVTLLPEDRVEITLSTYNGMLHRTVTKYTDTLPVERLLTDPQSYISPFLKRLLRYQTYSASVEAEPEDAFIFIDGIAAGIGRVEGILLPAGRHRVSVTRNGYEEYTDMFTLTEDGFRLSAVLRKKEGLGELYLDTEPQDAAVYVDERYAGQTPLRILVPSRNSVVTLRRQGYREESIGIVDLLEGEKAAVTLRLLPADEGERLYDRAERLKRQAKILSYTGIGMTGVSILLGVQKTLYEQKADLYRKESNDERYRESLSTANTLSTLFYISSAVTAGIFVFSFSKLIHYFTLYKKGPDIIPGTGETTRER
ncbi:MAG: hypothetical protein AMS17_01285 [Spirochaetes bacterium DG_61]|nr:MAG: hypothetical protein AMS17_01285 [Spirochaetes bacterium DG_61]